MVCGLVLVMTAVPGAPGPCAGVVYCCCCCHRLPDAGHPVSFGGLHSFRFVFGSWVLYGSGRGSFGASTKQRPSMNHNKDVAAPVPDRRIPSNHWRFWHVLLPSPFCSRFSKSRAAPAATITTDYGQFAARLGKVADQSAGIRFAAAPHRQTSAISRGAATSRYSFARFIALAGSSAARRRLRSDAACQRSPAEAACAGRRIVAGVREQLGMQRTKPGSCGRALSLTCAACADVTSPDRPCRTGSRTACRLPWRGRHRARPAWSPPRRSSRTSS